MNCLKMISIAIMINQTSGKTIFVGLGKSGHIAEKCDTFVFGFIHKNTIL